MTYYQGLNLVEIHRNTLEEIAHHSFNTFSNKYYINFIKFIY